ncbi:hypothetical protein ACJIZ3_013074 [Penstemon smallii]|uniref:SURP motif domain-containing protein n=1 Tax=Penstemon smallii TaxID=265156 RepID=A0ABD3UNU6_9LAMI
MPDHHLHAYFRFLVEHPELLNSESDGKSQDESKKAGGEHIDQKGVGGALSLLGSVYGTGEEEDGDDTANTEKNVPQDNVSVVNNTMSQGSKNLKSKNGLAKDEPVPILSNKEKILGVKKNSSITKTKSGSVKGIKKDAAEGKSSSLAMEHTSKIEPIILEPPPDLKRVINKLVEFIMRNGKQFEATLIEQDTEHGRFPFLLPSNHYHPYYLKVLQTAQESKVNGKSSCSVKDEESKLASLTSALCDMPTESDRKEKFKMVIGKSKKETQEAEFKGTQQECGITVDAAAAAAILQAATRGIKSTNLRMISSTSQSANGHVYSSDKSDNTVEKSDQNGSRNADSSEALLTEEQKLKAERLKRAKMFVANLKSGAVPSKTGTLRGSSLEPLESVGRVNVNDKEREDSLAPIDVDIPATDEKPDRNYFSEEQTERLSKRKYRSRSDICEEEDEDRKEHDERHSRRKYRSKSRRHREDDDNDCAVEKEKKHHRRHRSAHSSSEEIEDEEESIEEDKDHKLSKKKHRSHHSSHEHSRKRRSSKKHSDDENDLDNEGKDHKRSRKKHRSHRSSHHSRDKYRHKHHSRENESRRHLKHHSSSDDEHQNHSSLDKHKKVLRDERDDLEEGEIISRVSEESRGIVSGHVSRETSVDVVSSHQRASSQPSETTTEVPDDLRAKIRAMLMATRM